jgi:hypothetical protein
MSMYYNFDAWGASSTGTPHLHAPGVDPFHVRRRRQGGYPASCSGDGYGLTVDGWYSCDYSNCAYSGLIDGVQGMTMVR